MITSGARGATRAGRRAILAVAAAVAAGALAPAAAQADSPPGLGASPPGLGPDFLWGVSSSGFQSEGAAPDSNWSRLAASGRMSDPYGDSVDFYHRYPQDIRLAADLGVKVYRISVEWARVQPEPDRWDEQGFAFYDRVIAAIRAAGMRPMITLDHWVYPGWADDRGGWSDPGMPDAWLANARRVVDRYAGADPLWVTINEPTAYAGLAAAYGGLPVTELPAMFDRLATVHEAIYDYIHARTPDAMVTSNVAYLSGLESLSERPFEDRIANALDYIGIDYYYGDPPGPEIAAGRPWESALQPEGIYYALRHYARAFPGKPLYIVENGMPTENAEPRADGYTRADNLRDSIYWVQRAKADGMNIIGYNYWSLTDNYEWGSYTPRFGLYTVDVRTDPTLTRHPTDAVPAYRAIITANSVPADYYPTRPPLPCSIVDPPTSCTEPVR
ncbi:family 1 glycosylhydrolase [Nocardia sp. NPDC004711]